jgi:hypothetical protein
MSPDLLIDQLRQTAFYRGQILKIRHFKGEGASTCSLETLFSRVSRLKQGSLDHIIRILGMTDVYNHMVAGFDRAFPANEDAFRDVVLMCPNDGYRDLFWRLCCFVESLDEARLSLVICHNSARLHSHVAGLRNLISRADIGYALSVASIDQISDFGQFENEMPMIVVATPAMLQELLQGQSPMAEQSRNRILSCLGRVVIPSADEWPPALATNTAFLFRQLHLESAMRGNCPTLLSTVSPCLNVESYISEFWGKPLPAAAVIHESSVETAPLCVVNYGGSMVRDREDPGNWVRESLPKVAEDLLGWLVEKNVNVHSEGSELHYVLDISGSMDDCLSQVVEAIINDLRLRIDAGSLVRGDRIVLTVFNTEAKQVFPPPGDEGAIVEGTLDRFAAIARALEVSGGTDLPVGLGSALSSALSRNSKSIEMVLFSDGCSELDGDKRGSLLKMSRKARSDGRDLSLLYVVLDLQPPSGMRNFISELGGHILSELEGRDALQKFRESRYEPDATVIFLAGEKGLPESIVQKYQTGRRKLVYTRDVAKLRISPKSIYAVVVSGRFGSLQQIRDQVANLGNCSLPVFVLAEPEAWTQLVLGDHPESHELLPVPLIWTRNLPVAAMRLEVMLGTAEVDPVYYRYLLHGPVAYGDLMVYLGYDRNDAGSKLKIALRSCDLPSGFEIIERQGQSFVQYTSERKPRISAPLHTYTDDLIKIEGEGVSTSCDRVTAPLLWARGKVVDFGDRSVTVERFEDDRVRLAKREYDRTVPVLAGVQVAPIASPLSGDLLSVSGIGELSFLPVRFVGKVVGWNNYPRSNLDGRSIPSWTPEPSSFSFDTFALRLRPEGRPLDRQVLVGLANILRLTVVGVLKYADQSVFVYPEEDSVWVIDTAAGGNGAAHFLFHDQATLGRLLSLGGRVLLDCPCEGGFAGASTQMQQGVGLDNGCPRCTRACGTEVVESLDDKIDIFSKVSKRMTLEWLHNHRRIPTSAEKHLVEKYEGIVEAGRITGEDVGTRRGCLKLVRRILRDRLGLEIDDTLIANFEWMTEKGEVLGTYESGPNKMKVIKGLREWFALDVLAHELFHNYQYKCEGLFNQTALGDAGSVKPAFGGKLFLEGSATWAESHIVDSLAIRSSLTMANLRETDDEYGAGFQIFKHLEENHGVASVLAFLRSGDISQATAGKIKTLDRLYALAGVSSDLKP